ncbi:unnamed protein product [Euphydryas editha]|uniref:Crossover junction endonuclease EME1 n=1 Tax=Euphydryas editha TaxID=104508 RepID=A0AAU9U2S6_EUPED|nr:unnamed protein product [Euphydryas editha]
MDMIELSSDDSNHSDHYVMPKKDLAVLDTEDNENEQIVSSSGRISKKRRGRNKDESLAKKQKADRQALKQKIAEERRAAKNANKIFKPGECMKHMTLEIHPVLLESWFCADVQRELSASGAHLKTSSTLCDPALVLWTRLVPPSLINNDGMVELSPSKQRCNHGLYIQTAQDIENLVATKTLANRVQRVKDLAGCDLTLVLFGVKDYFKTSGRKTNNSKQKLMTEIDLEKAITDLLVTAGCDTQTVNTPGELALSLVHFTKAIAEEPYKKAKRELDEQADFYMRGDNKKCVSVDKDGNGLSRLWQQMIAILPLSSLETSRALCAQYQTPLALYEALQKSTGVTDVANVGVSRAAVPGSKSRRIGPEFARKLHTLFTADDGSVLLE